MKSQELVIAHGPVRLAATLTGPAAGSAATAVLCIHGTGPLDRDENMAGQRLEIFNTLARALAQADIACLRYDKRGCGQSSGDYLSAGHHDLTEDARACLRELRQRGIQRAVLLGHSEGTVIAARLAAEADALVLLAPFITPLREILQAQAQEMANVLEAASGFSGWLSRLITRLQGGIPAMQSRLIGKLDRTDAPVIRHMGRRIAAKSLRELMALDLRSVYSAVQIAVLAISGGKDVQCPPGDGDRIGQVVGGRATTVLIPELTHLLRCSAAPPGFLHYADQLHQPVDPGLVQQVTDWIRAR